MKFGYSVAVCVRGAVGFEVARGLDAGIASLRLIAVAARDPSAARMRVVSFRSPPPVVSLSDLARADAVVEAAPAAIFDHIAEVVIDAGKILIPASVGALLPRMDLIARAAETGARILPPTGALLGTRRRALPRG